MELAAIFGSSLLISLSGALMPGPLFTLSVRETLRRGFWVGPMVATGHALIELVLVIGLALGLKEFLDEGVGTAIIALLGGLFLLWMGFHMVRTAPRQELVIAGEGPADAESDDSSFAAATYRHRLVGAMAGSDRSVTTLAPLPMLSILVPAGILVSIANPYWSVWWASIGMAQMSDSLDQGVAGVGAFYTAHILSDFVWLAFVSFLLATGRKLMNRRAYQAILLVCGLFLLALGVRFLYSGIDFFS